MIALRHESGSRRGTPGACLVAALARMSQTPLAHARRYFAAIEARFDLSLLPFSRAPLPAPTRDAWATCVQELVFVLVERLRRRTHGQREMPACTNAQVATARATARLLRALTIDAFPECARGDLHRFVDAMERYANGELRWTYRVPLDGGGARSHFACEPDSSYHALWAEFALLAIELGACASFFRAALPAYVATMQLYGEAYAASEPPQPLGTRGRFERGRQASAVVKELLRREIEALNEAQLERRHVALVRRYCAL